MSTNPSPSKRSVSAQIGHVCMVDRVAFSLLSLNEQSECVEELRAFVGTIPAYIEADAEESVIPLDTGDGLVLVFLGDPQLAGEAALALRDYSQTQKVPLRIGLSSGPVTLRTDLAGKPNASGPGIDLAQRVMSVAEPSTVMISRSMADNLLAFDAWRPLIHEAGSFTVKHEQEIFLYRFHSGLEGGAEPPPAQATSPATGPPVTATKAGFVLSSKQAIALVVVCVVLLLGLIGAGLRLQTSRVAEKAAIRRETKIDQLAQLVRDAEKLKETAPPKPPATPTVLTAKEKTPVTVDYRNTNIRIVLRELFAKAKAPYHIDAGVTGLVTLKQENAPLGEVLKNALVQVGAAYSVDRGRFKVSMAPESSDDYYDPYGLLEEDPT